jgi:hypothetical protein
LLEGPANAPGRVSGGMSDGMKRFGALGRYRSWNDSLILSSGKGSQNHRSRSTLVWKGLLAVSRGGTKRAPASVSEACTAIGQCTIAFDDEDYLTCPSKRTTFRSRLVPKSIVSSLTPRWWSEWRWRWRWRRTRGRSRRRITAGKKARFRSEVVDIVVLARTTVLVNLSLSQI